MEHIDKKLTTCYLCGRDSSLYFTHGLMICWPCRKPLYKLIDKLPEQFKEPLENSSWKSGGYIFDDIMELIKENPYYLFLIL